MPSVHLLALTATFLIVGSNGCTFPDFMQTHGEQKWFYKIQESGSPSSFKYQIQVKGGSLEATFQTRTSEVPFNSTCLKVIDGKKFLVGYKERSQAIKYSCIQFVVRGPNVVQWKRAAFSSEREDSLCSNNKLKNALDDWVLIKYGDPKKDVISWPYNGGWDMEVRDNRGQDVSDCNENTLQSARMEANCDPGSGLHFNFRDCQIGSQISGIYGESTIVPMATWHHESLMFTVLKLPKAAGYYLLRTPKSFQSKSFEAQLFDNVVAYPTISSSARSYIKLTLTKRIVHGLCEDLSSSCPTNPTDFLCKSHPDGAIYCPDACDKCNQTVDRYPKCDFPKAYHGKWHGPANGKDHDYIIEQKKMVFPGSKQAYTCIDLPRQRNPQSPPNPLVAVKYQENGCYPRVKCIKFEEVGPDHTITTRMTSADWAVGKTYDTLCGHIETEMSHVMFKKDKYPTMKTNCGLKFSGKYKFEAESKTEITCTGTVVTGCDKQSMALTVKNCSSDMMKNYIGKQGKLRCLRSEPKGQGVNVMAAGRRPGEDEMVQCLRFKSRSGDKHSFHVFDYEHCNATNIDDAMLEVFSMQKIDGKCEDIVIDGSTVTSPLSFSIMLIMILVIKQAF